MFGDFKKIVRFSENFERFRIFQTNLYNGNFCENFQEKFSLKLRGNIKSISEKLFNMKKNLKNQNTIKKLKNKKH